MRAILLCLLLLPAWAVAECPADSGLAPYKAKLSQYVSAGLSAEEVAAHLQRWFGKSFEVFRTFAGSELEIRLVSRNADGQITCMHTIGSIQEQ